MKKQIVWAAIAAVALTSCQEEKDFQNAEKLEKGVSIIMQGGATTRSGESTEVASAREGVSIELGKIGGQTLYLEETVVDLNNIAPETKGTPVYTENLGHLYRDKVRVHTISGDYTDDSNFDAQDNQMYNNAWRYQHEYSVNIWDPETTDVEFYVHAPSDMTAATHGVSNVSGYNNGSFSFSYTSPTTAENQQDIVFGWAKANYSQYRAAYDAQGGLRITLYHALSGVKFAIANDLADRTKNSIQVTGISLIGLDNTGTCTITDGGESISWASSKTATDNALSQAIDADDLVDFDKATDKNHFGDTYFNGGTNQNLNDAQATKTFWLIPQGFSDSDAVLRISYTMNGRNEYLDINLGDAIPSTTWSQGQLRTYTLRLDEVNVKIEDTVTIATATEHIETPWGNEDISTFKGSTKQDVTITNTSNTDAYIRVALIGQWRTPSGDPVFGYTDFTEGVQLVDSWYMDQFVTVPPATKPAEKQGKFTGLPGNNWVKGDDGFYYYTQAVAPGKIIGTAPEGATNAADYLGDPLFTKYEILSTPAAAIAGAIQNIHFTLEIAVQAISTNKLVNGTKYTNYQEAWAAALASE